MTVRLQPEHERALEELLASGKFASMEEAVAQAVEHYLESAQRKPIWEKLQEIRDSIDPHAFDGLPEDGASQIDHYIYGLPKRDE
jgi:Arc/MetJ-type ribon-helix-helix transcriptional regulator